MFLEIALYVLVLMIAGMLVFKIAYSLYDSIRHKKPFEEINKFSDLEHIIGELKCPKDFYCIKSANNPLDDRTDSGMKSFVVCLEEKLQVCTFSLTGENHSLCKCPLRDYISNELYHRQITSKPYLACPVKCEAYITRVGEDKSA